MRTRFQEVSVNQCTRSPIDEKFHATIRHKMNQQNLIIKISEPLVIQVVK